LAGFVAVLASSALALVAIKAVVEPSSPRKLALVVRRLGIDGWYAWGQSGIVLALGGGLQRMGQLFDADSPDHSTTIPQAQSHSQPLLLLDETRV